MPEKTYPNITTLFDAVAYRAWLYFAASVSIIPQKPDNDGIQTINVYYDPTKNSQSFSSRQAITSRRKEVFHIYVY